MLFMFVTIERESLRNWYLANDSLVSCVSTFQTTFEESELAIDHEEHWLAAVEPSLGIGAVY